MVVINLAKVQQLRVIQELVIRVLLIELITLASVHAKLKILID